MPVHKRQEIPALLKKIEGGETTQIYLVFGERYLCQQAAGDLLERLIPDEKQRTGNLTLIDGENEDPARTLNELRTFSLFGGRRVIRVMDSKLLHSKVVAKPLWDKAEKCHQNNDQDGAGRYIRQVLDIGGMTPQDLQELPESSWKSKLGFNRPQGNLDWISEVLANRPLPAETQADSLPKNNPDLYMDALKEGIPGDNILILLTDAADKRKKLYKFITEHGSVLDLSVDSGTHKAATDSQKQVLADIIRKTLADFDKKLDPKALETLLERVGFHPVAAALESEKLALYTEDRERVTVADINDVTGRTREEAVFELSEAFSNRNLAKALIIAGRLTESGLHPLAIIATLRNHIKKMLTVSSMQELDKPAYSPGLSFAAFKDGYLSRLKSSRESWPAELPGHPYALYMMFQKTENFKTSELVAALSEILSSEYRLKSSTIPERLLLESMLFHILGPAKKKNR